MHEELDAALLAVWTSEGEIVSVGADAGDGPLVLHLSNGGWERRDTGVSGHLWWLAPHPDGDLWMVGANGNVLKFDRGSGAFSPVDVPTDKVLFGVWFADDGEGWMVGGDILADPQDGDRGVLLRGSGADWETVDAPEVGSHLLFKVWGTGPEDVWVVGEFGLALHLEGDEWKVVETGVSKRLLTVHGTDTRGPIAVGGTLGPTLLEYGEGVFEDQAGELGDEAPALNGVFVHDAGSYVVGNQGLVAHREDGAGWEAEEEPLTIRDLHAVTVAESGEAWAVGGNLLSPALDAGVMLHFGPRPPPTTID